MFEIEIGIRLARAFYLGFVSLIIYAVVKFYIAVAVFGEKKKEEDPEVWVEEPNYST